MPPNMFQFPKVLTEAEVIEAEEELKALQRHAFAIVDPEVDFRISDEGVFVSVSAIGTRVRRPQTC